MEQREYATMYGIEDHHWWYVGLRDIVFSILDDLRQAKNDFFLLDAGCGTGGVLSRCDNMKACGFDVSAEAISFCKTRNCDQVLQATICEIPFNKQCFDVVVSLDTLTCLEREGRGRALAEIYRVLKPGGMLVMNLPAYQWLTSRHDRAVGTRRRCTTGGLREELEKAGFRVTKMTYRNMFLFPAIAIKRVIDKRPRRGSEAERSDLKTVPEFFNRLLSTVLFFENKLLSRISFPFGLSVFCVAQKDGVDTQHGTE